MLNLALAQELVGLSTHFKRTWAYPSQDYLVERLRKRHGQTISRRTLNRHLGALEAAGWIKRQTRHYHDKKIGWVFRSTLYVVLGPCWRMVKRMAGAVAHAAGWRPRVPQVAHNVTPTGLKSSPGAPASPPANSNKGSATGNGGGTSSFLAEARRLLAR